jgi:heme/copper-type cytochrome/quinol oxidase subunit 3
MSAIPYTIDPRPDTGVNNVQLGVWLFLASEVMLFGGLFSAYFMLRAGAIEPWLPLRDHLGGAGRNTMLLIASTGAFAGAVGAARARLELPAAGKRALYRWWLVASILFALGFCASKVSEYFGLVEQHQGPAASTQLAVYFLLTGVHLLHVAGGTLVNAWLAVARPSPAFVINRLQATALYWMFVDLVWLVLVVVLYVV